MLYDLNKKKRSWIGTNDAAGLWILDVQIQGRKSIYFFVYLFCVNV